LAGVVTACVCARAVALHAGSDVPLAIKGYDPVAYFTLGKPTPGSADIEYRWDDHRYRFARPDHREMFKRDPARYAPEFENYCAMALARGDFIEAEPESWLISDGRLYIFAKPVGVERFRLDPAGIAEAAKRTWLRTPP